VTTIVDKKVLLLVDDIPSIRRDLCEAFAPLCREVLQAGNGQEALELIQNHPVDVVVCDIQMPMGNGFWLIQQLQKKKIRPLYFCFYSALSRSAIPREMAQLADEVFAKFSDFEALSHWVKESLAS
jgi:CheY-like chemotaxis protein